MTRLDRPPLIVMVDDDAEDCLLVRDALQEVGVPHQLSFFNDGEELLDYLAGLGEYGNGHAPTSPDLILLDLKMPRLGGRETLRALRAEERWRAIPVVALTTSTAHDDIIVSYQSGANSYITKPATFRDLVEIMRALTHYWFSIVELPPRAL